MALRSWIHQELPRIWLSRGWAAYLLKPVAWVYEFALLLRTGLYQIGLKSRHRLPARVIVVGNVVTGGAGKTPVTMALVQHLQDKGLTVGVISRGHGRQTHDTREVLPADLPEAVGDEPLLIRQKTGVPVWVGLSRVEAGRALLDAHPQVTTLVCDDGLQHWALERDIEICVMDERGVGNGWLLPAGPLREKWPRAVDLVLHTGTSSLSGGFQAQRQLGPIAHDAQGRTSVLSDLKSSPVDAVAGLARPDSFFNMLRATGLDLATTQALPDHFDFASWPSRKSPRTLLCTEKDAAKLWQRQPTALAVPLMLTPEPAFWHALDALLAKTTPHS